MNNRHRLAALGAVIAIGASAAIAPAFVGAEAPTPSERSGAKQAAARSATDRAVPDAAPTAAPSLFVPITPYRMYDSRDEVEPWFPGQFANYDATTDFQDAPQIPANATGVTFNVTIVTVAGQGFVQILTPGGEQGATSTVNWTGPGESVANGGSVGLVGSLLQIYVGGSSNAAVDVIIDVTGYYTTPAA